MHCQLLSQPGNPSGKGMEQKRDKPACRCRAGWKYAIESVILLQSKHRRSYQKPDLAAWQDNQRRSIGLYQEGVSAISVAKSQASLHSILPLQSSNKSGSPELSWLLIREQSAQRSC